MLLPLLRYADFSGRSRRLEFWMFWLLWAIALIGFTVWGFEILVKIGRQGESPHAIDDAARYFGPLIATFGVFAAATFIPSLAVQVRRFHDQDKSGLLVLLNLIPMVGGLIVLAFMCIEGTSGPNRYGPDPKADPRYP